MRQGFSVIEVLLSVVILSLFVMSSVGAALYGQQAVALTGARNRAASLASEGLEADRSIRDANFSALTPGTFGLTTAGNTWHLSGSSDLTDIFTRVQNIATASGDDNRRDVTSSATWQQNLQRTGSVSITTRFTNWFRKFGNWAIVTQQSNLNLAGNQAGNKVALSGHYAYVVRNGGVSNFSVIDVSNPASPTLAASLTLANTPQNIYITGTTAYVASSSNAEELQIIDISNPLVPVQVGSFNATGSVAANGVFAVGTTVYLTRSGNTNNFLIINASNPAAPTQTSGMSLNGPLYEAVVMGNYAYVSSGDNASELQVVDVSNPVSPALVGSLNLAGNADAVTIAGFQSPDTVFLGQNDGAVSIVNVTTPAAPSFLSSFAAGTSTNDIAFGLSNGYLLMSTAHSTQEFQVLDISTLTAPTLLGTVNLGNALNGVVYDQVRDRVYVVGTNNSAEFIVLQPL
jgi:Tfp pilus assembly protein PilV